MNFTKKTLFGETKPRKGVSYRKSKSEYKQTIDRSRDKSRIEKILFCCTIPCALEDRGEEEEEKEGEAKRATVIGRAGWRALGFSRNRVARGGPEKRMDEWEKEKEAERLERWLPLAVLVWNKGSSKGTRPRCNDFAHARNSIL